METTNKETQYNMIVWLTIAIAILVSILLFSRLRFTAPPHFTIESAGDAFLDGHTRKDARVGKPVPAGMVVVTQGDALTMAYGDTRITLQPNVTMRVREVTDGRISLLATRGTFFVEPGTNSNVEVCTRRVCANATNPLMVEYVTPGEIAHIRPTALTHVVYNDRTQTIHEGDELVVDELAQTVTLNGTVIEW